jgi:hypothetical protein
MKNIAIAAALMMSGLYAQSVVANYTVTCESSSGQTRNCPLYNGGTPYLQTQLSRAGCYEGQTWGHYDNSIWVSNGCRATFSVQQNGSRYQNDNESASNNGKALAATAAVVLGAAAIAAAAHNSHKNDHGSYNNENYGYNNYNNNYNNQNNYQNYNNYNNSYNGSNNGYYGGYSDRSVTCESEHSDRKRCPASIGRGHVEVSRQLSKANCRFGSNWNYDKYGIYVWDGCRAVFSVY